MTEKKKYCSNCGKFGHIVKECNLPITSIGIMCIKLDMDISINHLQKFLLNDYLEINNFNYSHLNNIHKINYYKNKIKFLLVKRKNSLNYIDFIRGNYDYNDIEHIQKMFSLMSKKEVKEIKEYNFDKLWNSLWKSTARQSQYMNEFYKSKKKFNYLKKNNIIDYFESDYEDQEWELPKGKKNNQETNLNCAIREIYEETNLKDNDYTLLNNLFTFQDEFKGTNNVNYKHVYYLALSKNEVEPKIETENVIQNKEVDDIGFFTWVDTIKLIRPYYESKQELINKIFLFMINIIEDINQDFNQDFNQNNLKECL